MADLSVDDRMLEALLLSSREPLTAEALREKLPPGADLEASLRRLADSYGSRSVGVVPTAGGWTVAVKGEHADLCRKLLPPPVRLSRAALETLSAIALFQPVTRPEIERVRGVSLAKGTLDLLVWAGYVRPAGRRQAPGNPLVFVTTDAFLRRFSLPSISDLPGLEAWRDAGLLDAEKASPLPPPEGDRP